MALIIINPPSLNQALCLGQGFEPVDIQALIAEPSVQRIDESIIGLPPWIREVYSCPMVISPHNDHRVLLELFGGPAFEHLNLFASKPGKKASANIGQLSSVYIRERWVLWKALSNQAPATYTQCIGLIVRAEQFTHMRFVAQSPLVKPPAVEREQGERERRAECDDEAHHEYQVASIHGVADETIYAAGDQPARWLIKARSAATVTGSICAAPTILEIPPDQ